MCPTVSKSILLLASPVPPKLCPRFCALPFCIPAPTHCAQHTHKPTALGAYRSIQKGNSNMHMHKLTLGWKSKRTQKEFRTPFLYVFKFGGILTPKREETQPQEPATAGISEPLSQHALTIWPSANPPTSPC